MGTSQPTYTREFKQQAVHLFETSGKNKTHIARELGISDSTLSKWCKEFGEHEEEAFSGKGHQMTPEKAGQPQQAKQKPRVQLVTHGLCCAWSVFSSLEESGASSPYLCLACDGDGEFRFSVGFESKDIRSWRDTGCFAYRLVGWNGSKC